MQGCVKAFSTQPSAFSEKITLKLWLLMLENLRSLSEQDFSRGFLVDVQTKFLFC